MKAYKQYDNLNLPAIDKEVLKFWEEENIFKRSVEQRDPENSFVFYEGPPSANGMPGIHHVMARTVKDLFCRFHTMSGKRVERKGGWDTHGLPIELQVEKELGITKEDIGTKISIEEYNQKCRETVMRYKNLWDDITVKMAYWVDLDNPYITFENEYIESVWYLLKRLYDKDLIYKGFTVQPYSPAAGTGLSTHELNQPGTYKEVTDTTVTAQFEIVKSADSDFLYKLADAGVVYALAWTTTPWTLPSNTALAVGKDINYLLIKTYNPYTFERVNLLIAEDRLSAYFKKEQGETNWVDSVDSGQTIPYRVLGTFKGSELEAIRYHQLLPFVQPTEGDAFKILVGDFVSTADGTGIVHLAPSFGEDDKRVAEENGVGALTLVDKQGKFTEDAGPFAGRYVKNYKDDPDYVNVDVDIAVHLKLENKAFKIQKFAHNYPHCWRTDKPVLYYPLDSWFIASTKMKDRMVELNESINWKPAHTGEKRFGNWLKNLKDWNLSRSRYWGIPLPIWRTEDTKEQICIGSIAELQKEIENANKVLGLNQQVPEDLHRPYIDEVTLASPSGKPMKRELDLIDVWFDSGSMPYAQWHYPFENEEKFKQNFPADFIAEGVDQTRGWFFTLHAIATMAFDSVAYKNVVSNGLVQDKNGQKMSKRLGNAIEPFETIEEHGLDATRWYMISNAQPWDNLKFDLDGVKEVQRKFFGTLYNCYSFFTMYANIDKFDFSEPELSIDQRDEAIDKWILSLLNTLVKEVREEYEDYEPTNAARKIQDFVTEHLSNWYVRLSRRRFWKGEYNEDKVAAYQTLYQCLVTLSKLMAPIAPSFSDWMYRNLNTVTGLEAFDSVHLADFPQVNENLINKDLEERMEYAQRISSLVLSLRKQENIRVRQPLQRILLPVLNSDFRSQVEIVEDLIKQEVNIKEIEYVDDASGVIKKSAKPNFKTLGRRLGAHMKQANEIISNLSEAEINNIEKSGKYELEIDGTAYDLTLEDIEIRSEDIAGWLVARDQDLTVALDVQLSDDLIAEGTARELVNRIQNIRKDKDFYVTDRIEATIENHERIIPAVELHGDYIKREILANSLVLSDNVGGESIDLFDDLTISIDVRREKTASDS